LYVIELFRRDGRPLVVGHRGAPTLAPENTIDAFAAALELGVDIVELDVLALDGGPLVVAHSDRLEEITHGAARGRVGTRTLEELRDLAPGLPSFTDALEWFATAAPGVGLHVDLKVPVERVADVAMLLDDAGVSSRTVVSSADRRVLAEVARASARTALGLTYPEDRLEISRHRPMRPLVRVALSVARLSLPPRLPGMLRRAGAGAVMLQHRLVTPAAVARAHGAGCAVLAWTVDDPRDVARVLHAGVDAVITNDPGYLLATLDT
jgi:glycerophosphoryl diester phosphodiesterase